jgi:quinol monooxygenase YgiN
MAYVVCAVWVTKEGEEDAVAAALEKIMAGARGAEGILTYQFHRDPTDPRRFLFYEQYVDEASYHRHLEADYVREHAFGDAIPRLESRERTFWTTWDPIAAE